MERTFDDRLSTDPYFSSNIWDIKDHPDKSVQKRFYNRKHTLFDFSEIGNPLKTELKQYLQHILSKKISAISLYMDYIRSFQHLIYYFSINNNFLSIINMSAKLKSDYEYYLADKGIPLFDSRNRRSVQLIILERVHLHCLDLYSGSDPFNKDIWKLEELGLDQSRFVESIRRKTISFHQIPNLMNKKFAKEYIKYLFLTTDNSFSTIYGKLKYIKNFLLYLEENELININRNDVEGFLESLNQREIQNTTFNWNIFVNIKFIEYLIVKGNLTNNYFYTNDVKEANRQHSHKTVDEYVIKQIFSVLDQVPFQESCMFLLLYSTGMRVSEVCAIKKNALLKNKNGSFVRFYQQKMRKEVMNPIPESLYELLVKQRKKVMKQHGSETKYLFPYHDLGCYKAREYVETMQELFKGLEVKNPDGSLYHFNSHDYRHTLATTMILNDIPYSVVQKILHHESPEMTVSYIDIQDQQKIKKHKEFIDIKGKAMPFPINSTINIDDLAKVEWLKKSIAAQMLPNGMCALPVGMGRCPHANSCLTCGDFRTSKEFLPVHEKHLQHTCKLIDYTKQQGWQLQTTTNEEVKENLTTIIATLKEGVGK